MGNNIIIKINSSINSLAGYPYGKEIYENQVKDKIIPSEINNIIFPNHVTRVAISFIQGFTAQLIETYTYSDLNRIIKIQGSEPFLQKFYSCMGK